MNIPKLIINEQRFAWYFQITYQSRKDCYFKNKKFEQEIIDSFITDEKVLSIAPGDSKIYSGLKYVDNICSVIRRRINNNDKHHYYYLIEDKITK